MGRFSLSWEIKSPVVDAKLSELNVEINKVLTKKNAEVAIVRIKYNLLNF